MSSKVLKHQCLPAEGHTIYIRVLLDDALSENVSIGHTKDEKCTGSPNSDLLLVSKPRARETSIQKIHRDDPNTTHGILSSHPFVICGVEDVDFRMAKDNIGAIMQPCPVSHVSNARFMGFSLRM
jgi:hypothetical protein